VLHTYDHKFSLPKGSQVFVPSRATTLFGNKLITWVLKKWTPPAYCYHLREGGHVAAAKNHLADNMFLKLDLANFFDHVTRTKVSRSLEKVGFSKKDSFEFASRSTVEKVAKSRKYSIPYGFPQSMILATMALTMGRLGKELDSLISEGLRASVYVDDIIISTDSGHDVLMDAQLRLSRAAATAGLTLNHAKQQGPARSVTSFNIILSQNHLTITPHRLAEFETDIRGGHAKQVEAIIRYVNSINPNQANYLASI
jgi:hypothetical protein